MRGPRAARLKHPCDNPSWETSSTARCAYSRHASKQPSWQPTYRRLQEHGRAPSQRRPEPRVAPRESKGRYCTHRPNAQEHNQTGNIANCGPARLKAPSINHWCISACHSTHCILSEKLPRRTQSCLQYVGLHILGLTPHLRHRNRWQVKRMRKRNQSLQREG